MRTMFAWCLFITITAVAVISCASAFAAEGVEDTAWNKTFTRLVYGLAVDSNNNVYVAGDGNNLARASSSVDFWVTKFNPSGVEDTTNWNKNFSSDWGNSDRAQGVAVDNSNNIYVVGYGINLSGPGNSNADGWIKKFSASGVEDTANWNKNFTGNGSQVDIAYAVAFDSSDNVYVVGAGQGLVSGSVTYDWWLKKFSPSGVEDTTNWNKNFSASAGSDERARSVAIDGNDNIYVAGAGQYLKSATSGTDWWIKKFDANGVEDTANWNKNLTGPNTGAEDYAYSVAVDSNNNVYVVGYGRQLANSTSDIDWWIKKFSASGVEDTANWNKNFTSSSTGYEIALGVAVDGNNNVFVVGKGKNLVSGASNFDWWIKKFSSAGMEDTVLWNKMLTSTPTSNDYPYAVATDGNNNVYVGGSGGAGFGLKKFGAVVMGVLPNAASFNADSTNFSSVSNLFNVSSMVLATTDVKVRWTNSVIASGQDFDANIKMGSGFVSLNVSALDPTINTSAVVNLSGIDCNSFSIYYATGFYANAASLVAAGQQVATQNNLGGNCADATKCTNLACSNGVLTFTAQHFDGFGGGVGPIPVPEFGTWALMIAVCLTLAGTVFMRRKN